MLLNIAFHEICSQIEPTTCPCVAEVGGAHVSGRESPVACLPALIPLSNGGSVHCNPGNPGISIICGRSAGLVSSTSPRRATLLNHAFLFDKKHKQVALGY